MPKYIRPKEVIPWKKKYSLEFLHNLPKEKVVKFCRAHRLPYTRISRDAMIENISSVQESGKIRFLSTFATRQEESTAEHHLTPIHMKFALEYATGAERRTMPWWAKKFKVKPETIHNWLNWDVIKSLIEKYQNSVRERVLEAVNQRAELAVETLAQIASNRNTDAEIRRKAANDLLDYFKLDKSNKIGVNINQQQGINFDLSGPLTKEEEERYKQLMEVFEGGKNE